MQIESKVCKRKSGFTIIELLVATAVTAILAGLMIAMVSSVLSAWNRTSSSLRTNNDAKIVFDLLTEDLQGAVYRTDGKAWLAVDVLHQGGGARAQRR